MTGIADLDAAEGPLGSVAAQAAAVREGRIGALELTEAYLARIERLDGRLGAFLYVDPEGARRAGRAIDARRHAGEPLGRLAGVPIAVKDNLCTADMPTTCASRALEGYVPPYEAHVVERLRAEGAILLGKTNLDEFAMGSSNESSAYRSCVNPWAADRVPGGSSGGSAAATAAGLAAASLGSDTGGSVRQPGAFCGVVGLKPTYGRVSRYGLVAFASSLDQIGPIARGVEDAALLLEVLAGHDARDATCSRAPVGAYVEASRGGRQAALGGLRVGLLEEDLRAADAPVRAAIEPAIAALEAAGARVEPVQLPSARHAVSIYYVVATAEASSNLARYDGMRFGRRVAAAGLTETYEASRSEGFGPEVRRRILLGTYVLSAGYRDAYYARATRARELLRADYRRAFEGVDLLLGPVTPSAAFRLGEKVADPLSMYLSDVFTLPPSLAGLPALSLPAGLDPEGLPLGLQLTAPAFAEERLLRVASALEASLGGGLGAPPGC